jgi:PAS domain S-box-containing protein
MKPATKSPPEPADSGVRAPTWEDYRLLVESVEDYAIFLLELDGRVATWNLGAEKIKGYTADEIIGQHFSRFYTPEDAAAGLPLQLLATAERYGHAQHEGWRMRKDGTRFWAQVAITALRDEQRRVVRFAKVTRDLTDRRQAEEALRRSEERFRLLVESVTDYAIYMLGPGGQVATWNAGAERMKGYRPDEIIGRSFALFFPEDDVRAGKPKIELEAARVQGRFEEEGWRVRKDGERFWANVTLTAVHDSQGELVGFAKVTRDLTARRQAEMTERRLLREQAARAAAEEGERQLRESEERYRALSSRLEIILEGVADGITVQDRSGQVTYANMAAARMSGFASVKELVESSPAAMVERFDLRDEQGQALRAEDLPGWRALRGERGASAVLHVIERGAGREWWSRVRATAVTGSDGQPELAVNVWHDVGAERRQQLESRWLDEATAALTGSLEPEPMLQAFASVLVPGFADWCSIRLLDGERLRHGAVVHVDPAKGALLRQHELIQGDGGRQTQSNVLRTAQPELHEDVTDALLQRVARSAEELALLRALGPKSVVIVPIGVRERASGTMLLVHSDSGRRFDPHAMGLASELGRRAGIALENARLFAAVQQAAEEAESAALNAETANRLKDEFLATVSHELRTPLNAIVGWASILRRRELEPGIAKGIEVIERNARTQVKIIEDILDVSRIISGKLRLELKSTDLVAIAREAIEVVRPSASAKGIAIALESRQESCRLVADPERIQQVIWNLLSNAVKFTEQSGSVRVVVGQDGSNASLTVTDTGSGIDPEFVPHVFDRFKQADGSTTRRFGGLGLGLALVRHIVELHGGSVAAQSAGRGQGASFSITLPIRAVVRETPRSLPVVAQPGVEPVGDPAELKGLRVLVVDDDDDAREVLSAVLVEAGAVVQCASSVRDGIDAVQRFRPQILVSDIGMPDEDGYSFIRRVRSLEPAGGGGIPSIALTAYTRSDDRIKALEAGFTTHVGKPVNPEALVATVANLAAVARR